jgi:thymidylate synthase
MEHTWQINHLPKLRVTNLEAGDVAVCGSFAECAPMLPDLDDERVAFVAPLDSRSDLEWLLRGLHLHPKIRHLVICGDDPRATGEALRALWKEGLDEGSHLPGSRGSLSAEFDDTAIDVLRNSVRASDLRGKSLDDVASAIRDLPNDLGAHGEPVNRESRAFPNPPISERTPFLSRKTSFPIFSSDVGDGWLQLMNLVLRIGTEKQTSGGERIAEALNAIVTIETPVLEDGALQVEGFPDFFDFNSDDFDRFIVPFYAERLRGSGGIDQLEAVCNRLKESLDTRAATIVFVEPNDVASASPLPDLISATFNVIDRKLFGSFVLQSVDVYTNWPLEAMVLIDLQRQIATRLGLETGSSTFIIHSAHLRDRDWDRSQRVLKESFKRPRPLHVDPSGVFMFGNDGGKPRAMLLNHDASHIMWEEAFENPEDLSWYIVDVMPWLHPQHIRYVGQECAALMHAIREKECYLQG